ncbi:cytochrome P450 [Aulographum hederae CBS 113979]|uniref:Cytochrome P450 n=1 Tax=Aulographum hederae CBS 113979 TaxID=1176131 RepID=A0A6G1GIW5_9PEZI|nr:cytochrome P450 [Aulographum hederae CBS 113979]
MNIELLRARFSTKIEQVHLSTTGFYAYCAIVFPHKSRKRKILLTKHLHSRKQTTGIWALNIANQKFNFITAPSIAKTVLGLPSSVASGDESTNYFLEAFFGDGGATRRMPQEAVWNLNHKTFNMLVRDPWLGRATEGIVRGLKERVGELVTLQGKGEGKGAVDCKSWEKTANPTSFPDHVEVDLLPLIRTFVSEIAGPTLLGHAFFENNPSFLEDMWLWDSKFSLYLSRMPGWAPGLREATKARKRMLDAFEEYLDVLVEHRRGTNSRERWNDLGDVSSVMFERAEGWKEIDAPVEVRTCNELLLVWGLLVNTNLVIYWYLYHIYSTPNLLSAIRAEIDPFIKASSLPMDSSSPNISTAPPSNTLYIDINALTRSCPLSKSTYYEILRLYVMSFTFKDFHQDFHAQQSASDTSTFNPRSHPSSKSYLLRKGEKAIVAHCAHQKDARFFPNPEEFDARRFIVNDKTGKETVSMGTMKAFGGGGSMCKGRNYAEREVLGIGAAILAVWNCEPVGVIPAYIDAL